MLVLITAIGSYGDVHPFLGIANALRKRGHDVIFIASPFFESLINAMGFQFVPLGTLDDMLTVMANRAVVHPVKGPGLVGQMLRHYTPLNYRAVLENAVPGKTVLVYSTLALGSRLAQETLKLPGVSVHLCPCIFPSAYESPKRPLFPMPRAGCRGGANARCGAWWKSFISTRCSDRL